MAFNLGTAFLKVVPDMSGFSGQVGKAIDTRKLSKQSAVAGGVIAAGLLIGAKKAIDRAKDLNETVSATDATFKSSAKRVQEWSKDTEDAFSRTDYLGAAKSFGVFARAANLGDEASADFAKGLIGAAQDAASFHNALPSDVLQDFRSGLAGETEPLRKYGIILNEAALENQALNMGLIKRGETMTEQDKVLARQQFILENLGAAEGDWAKTRKSAANVERTQQANAEDLQATLGQGLLPIYDRLLKVGTRIVSWLTEHTGVAKALFIALGILAGGLLALSLALKIATVANTLFNVSIALTAGIVLGIILVLVALGVALVLAWRKSETFRAIVLGAWEAIRTAAQRAWGWVRDNVPPIFQELWNKFLKYLPIVLFVKHFRTIVRSIAGAWEWLSSRTSALWNGILRTIEDFVNKIIGVLNYLPGVDIGRVDITATAVAGPRGHEGGSFARGGMVQPRAGGVYRVAEAGHPEMVIPLDPAMRTRASGLLVETAQRLGLVTDYAGGGLVDVLTGGAKLALKQVPGVNLLFTAAQLLGRLPGIPQVPAFARGIFKYARGRAADFIRGRAPSVGGSLVQIGRQLLQMGYLVGEHPAFGGVAPVHTPGSYHYRGRALDINWPGGGAAEMRALDNLYAMLRKLPHVELLWRVADHFDHLHFAMANGGPVAGGRPYLVGERGPELFVPGGSGHIVPNHELHERAYAIVNLDEAMVVVRREAEGVAAGRATTARQLGRQHYSAPALGVA